MKISLTQIKPSLGEVKKNLELMFTYLEKAVEDGYLTIKKLTRIANK